MENAPPPSIDVLGQFKVEPIIGSIGFSQSCLMMLIAAGLILWMLWAGMRPRAVIPGRFQAFAELCYEGIHKMCVDTIGEEGRRFFPFVFALFFFILFGNLLGLLPFSFTFTSHIVNTLALAVVVFVLSTIVGLVIHGLHFFSYFYPEGTPKLLAPVVVVIEVISYFSRLISLPVRLFANMLAGHAMFEVLAAFVVMIGGLGAVGAAASILPFGVVTVLFAFELLVAFLQAYVFAILTCIYLHDAVHLH